MTSLIEGVYGDMARANPKFNRAKFDKVPVTAGTLFETVDMLLEAMDGLAARIKTLEAGHVDRMCYRGIWRQGESYTGGDVVTHGGTLWFCREATTTRPGSDSSWQLMAKTR